jgi:hypothetical protein
MSMEATSVREAVGVRARLRARARSERGFTLVELLVAALMLVIAMLGVASAFLSSNALSLTSERGTSIAQRAQSELERLEALPFHSLALTSMPTASPDPATPVSAGTFAWDRTSSATEPLVVDATNGLVPGTPVAWTDGRFGGFIYDFVTWHTDGRCGSGCPSSADYKRLTVEVTLTGARAASHPALVSTVVIDPSAAPSGASGGSNPLQSQWTTCQDAQGASQPCSSGLSNGSPSTWFFYDTPATQSYAAPTGNHATHATVAPTGTCSGSTTSGCPVPDLIGTTAPGGSTLYNYSSEQTADTFAGGRILKTDVGCSSAPTSTDNTKGELWVSAPLAANVAFTGEGGASIYTQAANSASTGVTLCIAIYDVPGSIANLVTGSPAPIQLGGVAYTDPSWPTVMSPVSFHFNFLASAPSATIAAGHRLGVRAWVASSNGNDIALAYDNPAYSSQIELNTQ